MDDINAPDVRRKCKIIFKNVIKMLDNIIIMVYNKGTKTKRGIYMKNGMIRYRITFKCDETGKTIARHVYAKGIVPAIEEAIMKMFKANTHGDFYYPVKAEEMNIGEVIR